ncbi:Sec-independent protein translocase subunit TatA/TatB [Allorhodopirellula heiligendammensis]|uniref:Sec-independent protein translocase protein TatA n=1 Tax=Allorhodopirellula heiligendammensis TaxID=2714739 RepID=A0A5C6C1A1_9BACT|nr:twin-arginine translocase TatA/TatE family subunit [Allorhodopirellula heiligendammensis]TWU18353.1 twin arginine translocase protein A [Allorhodopirellula heiligendammensis]|tara:strand:+ start:584 stop:811 length:228 start_codon:yes stop_codon:yes gene_type:complete
MLTTLTSPALLLGFIGGMPGTSELLIILFIALLLFGGSKLPSLMRNLGKSANEFKRGMAESTDDVDESEKLHEKV